MSAPKTTLFISDLHLSSHQPALQNLFLDFLQGPALMAEKIYILGDLFDVWVGHDIQKDFHQQIAQRFKALSLRGISLYFIAGNRDFLLQNVFLKEAHIQQLKDPTIISLYGKQVLLSHGDKFCTQDIVYQRYRKFAQHPLIKKLFLLLPTKTREKIAQKLRLKSKRYQKQQSLRILDVCPQSVEQTMDSQAVSYLIHGHVHRPQFHSIRVGSKKAMRFVLGDWHSKASYIISTPTNLTLATFSRQSGTELIDSYAFEDSEVVSFCDAEAL